MLCVIGMISRCAAKTNDHLRRIIYHTYNASQAWARLTAVLCRFWSLDTSLRSLDSGLLHTSDWETSQTKTEVQSQRLEYQSHMID